MSLLASEGMGRLQLLRRHSVPSSSFKTLLAARRSFFASSTDHTTLLQGAEVHCLVNDDIGVVRYVLAAQGMDLATVRKVPHLHLARLDRKDHILFGAKVVNRTLGTPAHVCGKLVDRALQDTPSVASGPEARSTLHGLSPWVLQGLQNAGLIQSMSQLDSSELQLIEAIARGDAGAEAYENGKTAWEKLVHEFVQTDEAGEAALYRSRGGTIVAVEHHADQSEYADSSAGSMAVFAL